MKKSLALTLSLFSCLVLAGSASAQAPAPTAPPPSSNPSLVQGTSVGGGGTPYQGLSAWGIVPWGGIGVGARYMIPIPSLKPLLTNTTVKDSFAAEFGADFLHFSYGVLSHDYSWNELLPVAGIMWNVAINDQLILYPKLELGFAVGWVSGWDSQWGGTPTHGGFFFDFAGGIMYRLASITLRAEAGYAGLKAGVGWIF